MPTSRRSPTTSRPVRTERPSDPRDAAGCPGGRTGAARRRFAGEIAEAQGERHRSAARSLARSRSPIRGSAGQARGDKVLAIEGDRIRFARAVFERAPALVIGVSRSADAVLIEDVGREVGYGPVKAGTEAMRDLLSGDKYSGPGANLDFGPTALK